ncbi:hypothetical protein Ssi03_50770 [Sphaerisporangium siamense]|uniref:Uncharacterized protein n=1 Tax=Sphaerisporangium siamense TaxID=795645 RepID=A0A7W7GB96_9ACTN|nr:hypothetical protein [Sphaerisporangium siamense]MBB4702219.1 hypothetical protein [Sphaerisporangium siamense]GII87087.1 hypothetical protein Ssi03_50770 [Sphaerisporangium siamense]
MDTPQPNPLYSADGVEQEGGTSWVMTAAVGAAVLGSVVLFGFVISMFVTAANPTPVEIRPSGYLSPYDVMAVMKDHGLVCAEQTPIFTPADHPERKMATCRLEFTRSSEPSMTATVVIFDSVDQRQESVAETAVALSRAQQPGYTDLWSVVGDNWIVDCPDHYYGARIAEALDGTLINAAYGQ